MHRIDRDSSASRSEVEHLVHSLFSEHTRARAIVAAAAGWEFFVQRVASPGARHFWRESVAARAALQTKLDRACAADALARLQESAGAFAGGIVLVLLVAFASGCGVEEREEGGSHRVFSNLASSASPEAKEVVEPLANPEDFVWPEGDHAHATLDIAGHGKIVIELLPELAPATVANFTKLAGEGFFDATTFHRVIPNFMVQGGDPNTRDDNAANDGKGGPGYTIEDEFSQAPHLRGVVSMANKGSADTGGSQFFIVHQTSRHLDGKYTAFGRVVSGIEVVDSMTQVEIDTAGRWGPKNRPVENIELRKVTITEAGAAAAS